MSTSMSHPAVDQVRRSLVAEGATSAADGIRWLDDAATTAAAAARALFLGERVGRRVGRASKELVVEATGQVIGEVAPVWHPAAVRTVVDVALADFDVVRTAAGHARTVFPTSFDELVRVTGGEPSPVVP